MATIERFEDLQVWQQARLLMKEIYAVSNEGRFARDFALRDQIRRAAISIMSNLAEGFERGGNREFQHFLATAKGSTGEVRSQLYVALDLLYIDLQKWNTLTSSAIQISSMISKLVTYLASHPELRGNRFKLLEPKEG